MAQDETNYDIEINSDNAILLLAAAEVLGLDAGVVETTSSGTFRVPQKVVDKAGLGKKQPEKKAAAKKAAPAKKAAAKAAATKKK
jgi:hypothetical protein